MTPPPILGTPSRRRMLGWLLLAGAAQAALTIATAVLFGRVAGSDLGTTDLHGIATLVLCALIALLLHAHIRARAERFGQSYVAVCRARLLKSMVRTQRDNPRHGLTMTRMITDLSSIKNLVGLGIAGGLANAITLAGLAAGGFWLSGLLGLAITASIVVSALAAVVIALPLRTAISRARKARGALAARVGEALLTTAALRVFGALDREKSALYAKSATMTEELAQRYWWATLLRRAPEVGFVIGLAAIAIGGRSSGLDGVGPAVLILSAATLAQRQIVQSLDLWFNYTEGRRKLSETLSAAGPRAETRKTPGPLGVICQRLRGSRTLRRLSLDIPPGQRAALPASANTSALFRVLAGLATPHAGRVRLIDEMENRFRPNRTSGSVVLVSPEVPLRRGSIADNLLLGARDVPQARLEEVAWLCGLWQVAGAKPGQDGGPDDQGKAGGLPDIQVPEAGRGLSPALAARIRLARALLAEPDLLLIDDPVLELDPVAKLCHARALRTSATTVLVAVHGNASPIETTLELIADGRDSLTGTVSDESADHQTERLAS